MNKEMKKYYSAALLEVSDLPRDVLVTLAAGGITGMRMLGSEENVRKIAANLNRFSLSEEEYSKLLDTEIGASSDGKYSERDE